NVAEVFLRRELPPKIFFHPKVARTNSVFARACRSKREAAASERETAARSLERVPQKFFPREQAPLSIQETVFQVHQPSRGLWPCWPRPNPIIAKHKGPQTSAGGRQVGPSQGLLRASPGFSSGHPKEFRAKG